MFYCVVVVHLPRSLRFAQLRRTSCTRERRRRLKAGSPAVACPRVPKAGADDQNRTGDLVLTKDALCQLSYIGLRPPGFGRQVGLVVPSRYGRRAALSFLRGDQPAALRRSGSPAVAHRALARNRPRTLDERRLERETGIEPATNSLEGCDSTTELLPPSRPTRRSGASARKPAVLFRRIRSQPPAPRSSRRHAALRPAEARVSSLLATQPPTVPRSPAGLVHARVACQPKLAALCARAKVGGEGRTRTFEATRATDLQSAAFDRSATSPVVCVGFVDVVLALRTGLAILRRTTRGVHHPGIGSDGAGEGI